MIKEYFNSLTLNDFYICQWNSRGSTNGNWTTVKERKWNISQEALYLTRKKIIREREKKINMQTRGDIPTGGAIMFPWLIIVCIVSGGYISTGGVNLWSEIFVKRKNICMKTRVASPREIWAIIFSWLIRESIVSGGCISTGGFNLWLEIFVKRKNRWMKIGG